jgi:hypothetical protein
MNMNFDQEASWMLRCIPLLWPFSFRPITSRSSTQIISKLLTSDEGGIEFVRAGLLLVGEMQDMGDILAVKHYFVAGVAAVLAARPGDDGIFFFGVVGVHEM